MDLSHLIIRTRLRTLRYLKQPTEEQAREACCNIAAVLKQQYPGYDWQVGANQDMIYIVCPALSSMVGFRMHMGDIDPEGRALMRAGGEILERFGVNRTRANERELMTVKRGICGNAIPYV